MSREALDARRCRRASSMGDRWRRRTVMGVLLKGLATVLTCGAVACGDAPAAVENNAPEPEVTVTLGTLRRTTLRSYVVAYGTIEPEPPRDSDYAGSARVTARVPGVVAEVLCREGQTVSKGMTLFRLDSRPIDVEIDRARRAVTFAEQQHERQRRLLEVEGTSLRQVQEAEQQLAAARSALTAAETQRSFLEVAAPLGGLITRIDVRPGEAVDATRVLADIVDPQRLVVAVRVPQADLTRLAIGQQLQIEPNRTETGSPIATSDLTFIDSAIDPATGTGLVRARLPERVAGTFRSGQFVTVRIVIGECKACLAAPIEGVTKDDAGRTVLAVVTGDHAEQRVVDVGVREDNLVEVRGEGLAEGQPIVTRGAYGLPPRTRIRATPQ
jgi:membrane fusion protein (multidrug efflux system)